VFQSCTSLAVTGIFSLCEGSPFPVPEDGLRAHRHAGRGGTRLRLSGDGSAPGGRSSVHHIVATVSHLASDRIRTHRRPTVERLEAHRAVGVSKDSSANGSSGPHKCPGPRSNPLPSVGVEPWRQSVTLGAARPETQARSRGRAGPSRRARAMYRHEAARRICQHPCLRIGRTAHLHVTMTRSSLAPPPSRVERPGPFVVGT
jgi:hypothetical protein